MKVLIEITHPARVHFFKNIYWELEKKGHEVLIAAVDKEKSIELLNLYDIPYYKLGANRKSNLTKFLELGQREIKLLIKALQFEPDVLLGSTSPVLGHVSFITGTPYFSFSDTEHATLTWKLAKPFINTIFSPSCFLKDFGEKHIKIEGYKELAYLHPNYFKPDPNIYSYLGIEKNEKYVLLRFISWDAQHDKGHKGLSDDIKYRAVKEFSKNAKVFISSEKELPPDLKRYEVEIPAHKMHDLLYYSSLYFGESGTMATEAAILGTPSVRVSSIAKLLGNFKELSEDYGLIDFFDSDELGYKRANKLLENDNSKEEWKQKSQKLFNDKIDVTKYLVNYITNKFD